VVKRYHVTLARPFPRKSLPLLVQGVVLEGEQLKVEQAELVEPKPNGSSLEVDVAMHHGKKREIRQLFTGLGHDVLRLRRYQIGTFRLHGIAAGAAKRLSEREVEMLFRAPRIPADRIPSRALGRRPSRIRDPGGTPGRLLGLCIETPTPCAPRLTIPPPS
jgi:23S rRNA pseudouridine2605 synthase